jgi:hypothetical protein
MVLLTSSSISVAISSGVVFIFTFLLFLSGYVVQQQTVRSLQAALHPPPLPTPTLPVYFQTYLEGEQTEISNLTEAVESTEGKDEGDESNQADMMGIQAVTNSVAEPTIPSHSKDRMEVQPPILNEPITEMLSAGQSTIQSSHLNEENGSHEDERIQVAVSVPKTIPEPPARLAYVQLLSNPSQICSALLFFKLQMDDGDAEISHVILYSSTWEEDISFDAFNNALALMRLVKDKYRIIYHPVSIDDPSEEQSIERGLVHYLSTNYWDYDRVMYLRSPGLALNIATLDSALQASKTKSLLSRNWARTDPEPSTAPSILLISEEGLHTPRGSNRRLTAEAISSHANHHENEMDVEAAAQTAAYVHFEEGELEHRRTEKEWYGGVFERYERGRAEICKGINFDGEKRELKRARKRGWR